MLLSSHLLACRIYEVIDAESEEKRKLKMRLLPNYNKALIQFREANFVVAKELFEVTIMSSYSNWISYVSIFIPKTSQASFMLIDVQTYWKARNLTSLLGMGFISLIINR